MRGVVFLLCDRACFVLSWMTQAYSSRRASPCSCFLFASLCLSCSLHLFCHLQLPFCVSLCIHLQALQCLFTPWTPSPSDPLPSSFCLKCLHCPSLSLHIFISLPFSLLPSLFSHPASVQLPWTLLCELDGLRASLKVHLSMDPPHTVTLRVSQQHTCPVLLSRVPQASGLHLAASMLLSPRGPWLPLGPGCCPRQDCSAFQCPAGSCAHLHFIASVGQAPVQMAVGSPQCGSVVASSW